MIDQQSAYNMAYLAQKFERPLLPRLAIRVQSAQTCLLCLSLIEMLKSNPLYAAHTNQLFRYKGSVFVPVGNRAHTLCGSWEVLHEDVMDVADIEPPAEPSLLAKAGALATSLQTWMRFGFAVASDEDVAKRRAICEPCPFWEGEAYLGAGKCSKCGCSGIKLKLATSKCPIGNWDAVNNS